MAASRLSIGVAVPAAPPWEDIEAAANLAQALDLDALMMSDHLVEFSKPGSEPEASFDTFTILGALSRIAPSLRVGVGVADLMRRHPIVVAQAFLTMAALGVPRPILGVGAGERLNTEPYGVSVSDPVSLLAEGLAVLRAAVHGEPIVAGGPRFRVDAPAIDLPIPAEDRPVIWIGARGKRMLGLTGRFADGWYPADIIDPTDYTARLAVVRSAARDAGREPGAVTPAGELIVVAGADDREAREALREPDVLVSGLLLPAEAWKRAGYRHPLGDRARGFVDYDPRSIPREALAAVPVDLVARHVLWGGPEHIAAAVRALSDAGMRHVNLAFGRIGDERTSEAVRAVVSAIRAATAP